MKKITLFSFVATILFGWNTFSQINEDFETDPPAGWTFMQTQTDDPGFVQTDFRANSGTFSFYHNDDDLEAESTSWMISPSYTVAAGDQISFYFNHNYVTLGYGVENGVWISTASADPIANPGDFTLLYDLLGNASEDAWTEYSQSLDAYVGQTIYIAFKYVGDFEDELYIDDFSLEQAPTDSLDYYNLQWPATGTIDPGASFNVYAQCWEPGLTDASNTPAVGIEAWIGYSETDTDPSGTGWTWIAAATNPDYDFAASNDEYMLDLGVSIPTAGTYYYASRWRLNGGAYTYGGIQADGSFGGAWGVDNNASGILTINGIANDLFANAIVLSCGDDVTGTTIGATQDEASAPSAVTGGGTDTSADNDSPWVWYSYTGSGSEEEVTLSTCGVAQTDFDTEIFVYTGTSGSLTLIDDGYDECGGGTENWAAETMFVSDGATTYYIAVGGYDSEDVGNFHLAISCVTLSVGGFENENAFTYFPNPVKNTLKLNAQANIQNVAIYNMLGQEVLKSMPNNMDSEIDMVSLQTGAYFVKVTINDVTETIRIIKQ